MQLYFPTASLPFRHKAKENINRLNKNKNIREFKAKEKQEKFTNKMLLITNTN